MILQPGFVTSLSGAGDRQFTDLDPGWGIKGF
jgi:hypothetical protein